MSGPVLSSKTCAGMELDAPARRSDRFTGHIGTDVAPGSPRTSAARLAPYQ